MAETIFSMIEKFWKRRSPHTIFNVAVVLCMSKTNEISKMVSDIQITRFECEA